MNLSHQDMEWAVTQKLLTEEQARLLWRQWEERQADKSPVQLGNLSYYIGALLIVVAMCWLLFLSWQEFGGWGLGLLALVFMFCFFTAGQLLWNRKTLNIPGGLMVLLAIAMGPVLIFATAQVLGWWPEAEDATYADLYQYIRGRYFSQEIAVLLLGLAAMRWYAFPLLAAVLTICLWLLAIEMIPLLTGIGLSSELWVYRQWFSLYFGLTAVFFFFLLDCVRRYRKLNIADYSAWGYCAGMLLFWSALTLLTLHAYSAGGEDAIYWAGIYCLINMFLLLLAIALQRNIFAIVAVVGLYGAVCSQAYAAYGDSVLFPCLLALMGITMIYLKFKYSHQQLIIRKMIFFFVPRPFLRCFPGEWPVMATRLQGRKERQKHELSGQDH